MQGPGELILPATRYKKFEIFLEKKMKITRASRVTAQTLGLMAVTAIASPFATANDTGWYLGGNVGQSRATIDNVRINSSLLAGGFTSTTITNSDKPTGFKIFGGYQLNRHFALEGGGFDLGRFEFVATTIPAGTLTGTMKLKGAYLDLVGILPLTEKFSVFGRVGANHAKATDTFRGTGRVRVLNPDPSKSDTNIKFGAGLQFAFSERLAMRAEVERYRIDDAVGNKGDIDLASIGLVYRFGRKVVVHTPRATAPEPFVPSPVAVAPAPAPVVVIPAPQPAPVIPPQPRRVTFSADALFDFDKSTLKPAGKQALEKFAGDLRGTQYDVITITGYTDRIGSDAYNAALSGRRAESVKSYLVDPAGIPAGRLSFRGAGEANPVTKPGECKGNNATKPLISCLQPDRRVEVEVSGTK